MSVESALRSLGRRGRYGGSWKKFFDYLKSQDTPESDIFFWAESIAEQGDTPTARELILEYLTYRRKHGRIGEYGLIGMSEQIAEELGINYNWTDA